MLNLNELCAKIAQHSPSYCSEAGKKHKSGEWQNLAKQLRKEYCKQLRLLGHAAARASEFYDLAGRERHARGVQALRGEMSRLHVLRQDDEVTFFTLDVFAGRSPYLTDLTRTKAGEAEQFLHNMNQLAILRGV